MSIHRNFVAGTCVTALGVIAVLGVTGARADSDMSKKDFIKKAAMGGMAEVQLGRLAEERASSPEVKAFAQRMVQDHSKANMELQQLAEQEGVQLPNNLDEKHRKTKDRLSELSGEAFDRAYMKDQLEDHKHDIKMFERQANQGHDQDVKAWAEKTVPTLRNHQQRAQEVARTIGMDVRGQKAADAPER